MATLLGFDCWFVVDYSVVHLTVAVDDFAAFVHPHRFGVEPVYSDQATTCLNRWATLDRVQDLGLS